MTESVVISQQANHCRGRNKRGLLHNQIQTADWFHFSNLFLLSVVLDKNGVRQKRGKLREGLGAFVTVKNHRYWKKRFHIWRTMSRRRTSSAAAWCRSSCPRSRGSSSRSWTAATWPWSWSPPAARSRSRASRSAVTGREARRRRKASGSCRHRAAMMLVSTTREDGWWRWRRRTRWRSCDVSGDAESKENSSIYCDARWSVTNRKVVARERRPESERKRFFTRLAVALRKSGVLPWDRLTAALGPRSVSCSDRKFAATFL